MHCGSEQGKIILDKPSTFKEKKENKGEHKLNARDIREWLERIPDEHLLFIGMDKDSSRPEWTIIESTPRPSDYSKAINHARQWRSFRRRLDSQVSRCSKNQSETEGKP